jgi:hypothetical protein
MLSELLLIEFNLIYCWIVFKDICTYIFKVNRDRTDNKYIIKTTTTEDKEKVVRFL